MKDFERELIKFGYYTEEEITREEYEGMNEKDRDDFAVKKYEEDSDTSDAKYYLKKRSDLTNEQIMVISQLRAEKSIETIKRIAIGLVVLACVPIVINFFVYLSTLPKYYL